VFITQKKIIKKERCVMGIIETLQAEIQSLKERVTALEQLTKGSDTPAPATRQLTRDDIIEMAKRDVAELLSENYPMGSTPKIKTALDSVWFIDEDNCGITDKCEFVVNREKRTVVALIKTIEEGKVVHRGIAKCHPDDCFNAHIGRAIALRRALGLEVPDEYLNAPQPTEVRVGDVVRFINGFIRVISDVKNGYMYFDNGKCNSLDLIRDGRAKIIDDSREEV
jgi:hypothetical protein